MVVPAFGWSVGDIVVATRTVVKICEAFKKCGGAVDKFNSATSFLQSFETTLHRLESLEAESQANADPSDFKQQVEVVRNAWTNFSKFWKRFEAYFEDHSRKSVLSRSLRVAQFTLEDPAGTV